MNKNVPKLRFEGFTDDWEQRKLKEITNHRGGTAIEKYFSDTGKYKVISIGSYGLDSKYVDQRLRAISNEITDGKIVKQGELTMVLNDKTANGTIIGRSLLIEEDNKYVINQRTEIVSPLEDFDSLFAYVVLNNSFREKVRKIVQGGTQIYVNYSAVENLTLEIPSIEEQQKIGSFFKQIDETITLQQRKLELLKEQKKGFLQKMFPKTGERFPELIFEGFTDAWEQCKLSEISDKTTEKNKSNEFSETLTNSAEYGIINQRDFFDKDISNEKNLNGYYIVHEDDFVYNPRISNFAPVGPIKRNKLGRTGVMSPLYYVFRTNNIDNTYLEYYFDGTGWHNFMKLNGDSGARADRFAIKDSVFKTMPIPYPSIKEQTKIGNFFKKLDDTITLQERKLDSLKEQKKGFLQQMFV